MMPSFPSNLTRTAWATLKKVATPFVLFKYRKIRTVQVQECERRKRLSLFDYQSLAQPLPYAARHVTKGMNLYGYSYIFPLYAGIKKINSKLGIEHGLYFSVAGKRNESIITMSDYRESFLLDNHSKAVKIGPYIHYADPLLNRDEQDMLKKQLGKVLLVFPTHSHDSLTSVYDVNGFLHFIEQKKTQFDTVVICMYWKDILLGKADPYKQMGYSIVTAGHVYDIYFLSRLKTIIELADVVAANDIGSYVGYCLYMQKSFYLFSQTIEYQAGESLQAFHKEINQRSSEDWKGFEEIRKNFTELCNDFGAPVSKELHEQAAYIFGFDYVKDKEALKKSLYGNRCI